MSNLRGITPYQDMKNREEFQTELRRKKRRKLLDEKRMNNLQKEPIIIEPENYIIYFSEKRNILQTSQSIEEKCQIIKEFRSFLDKNHYIPFEEMIQCRILSTLVNMFIETNNDELENQLLHFFINYSIPDIEPMNNFMIKNGLIKVLTQKGLQMGNLNNCVHVCWAISNFIVNSLPGKKQAIENGYLELMKKLFEKCPGEDTIMFAFVTLLKDYDYISDNDILQFLPYVSYILSIPNLKDLTMKYSIQALSFICKRNEEIIKKFKIPILIRVFCQIDSPVEYIRNVAYKFALTISRMKDEELYQLFDVTQILN